MNAPVLATLLRRAAACCAITCTAVVPTAHAAAASAARPLAQDPPPERSGVDVPPPPAPPDAGPARGNPGAADRERTPTPEDSLRDARWPAVEAAAARGLEWLAANQHPDGYWPGIVGHKQGDNYLVLRDPRENEARGEGHMGVTAFAGLAFLADGHVPGRGRYGEVMRRALDYVVAHVEESGLVRDGGTRMYSHAFGTLFLAEVHGMSGDRRTREALERAATLIIDTQNRHGAWRYNPFSTEADLSVTVCQLQALRAARNIGIRVPVDTIERAVDYVRRSQVRSGPDKGLYYYKIVGRGRYRKSREYAINAAALTALYSAGVRDPGLHEPALAFLQERYPLMSAYYGDHYFYWYGNYYACQAFFQYGGPEYVSWWKRASSDLLSMQRSDGRWTNRVGPGDPLATAVATIILLIPKQYLPIFQR